LFSCTCGCSGGVLCVDLARDNLHQGDIMSNTTKLYSKNSKTNPENLANLVIRSTKYDFLVWIANRDQPVDLNSAVLSLNHSGVLKIESQIAKPIILYSPPQNTNNTGHVRDPTLNGDTTKIKYISEIQSLFKELGLNPKSNNIVLDTGELIIKRREKLYWQW